MIHGPGLGSRWPSPEPISFCPEFLLGLGEAGSPRIILYLSYWFPQIHRSAVNRMFMAAAP